MADIFSKIKFNNKGYNNQELVIPQAVKTSGSYDLKTFSSSTEAQAELAKIKEIAKNGNLKVFFKPSSGGSNDVVIGSDLAGYTSATISNTGYLLRVYFTTSSAKLQIAFTSMLS